MGRYAIDDRYFSTTYMNGPLHSLSSGKGDGDGVYRYGADGVFPTSIGQSAIFQVDAVLNTP